VIYEEYSHTTCTEGGTDDNNELDSVDEGTGGPNGGGDMNLESDPEVIVSYIENRYGIELNQCEIEWVYTFGYLAYPIWRNREKAFTETLLIFGVNNGYDCSDAFRHAYWSAINYRDVGVLAAISMGAAHECNTPLGPDRDMDFHNNHIGFTRGEHLQNATDSEISNAIVNAMVNGELKIFNSTNNGLVNSQNCF
jgi:hypothetical protein